ncbi:SCP-like protein, partial [Teladorsagia circumcincta]
KAINDFIGNVLNEFRRSIATGNALMLNGPLPSSISMFELKQSRHCQKIAERISRKCVKDSKFLPAGYSMNFYNTSRVNASIPHKTVADIVIGEWESKPFTYGIGEDVKYTDTRLQDFANIIYYKSTEFGCYYQTCNKRGMPRRAALACVFNNAPKMHEPLYIINKEGRVPGCSYDSNCNRHKYSMGLEHDAQRYANSCPSKPSSLRSRHFQGENIAWISSYDASSIHVAASMAVKKFWHVIKSSSGINRKVRFTAQLEGRSSLLSFTQAVKKFWHVIKSSSGINRKVRFTAQLEGRSSLLSFTQMAWASTTKFGCGVKLCQNNYVVVCRYSPRGNIVNQNIYNVGKTCSECSACTNAYLYKGLCTA